MQSRCVTGCRSWLADHGLPIMSVRGRNGARNAPEVRMVEITREGRVVETAREARQGERGPRVLAMLTVSTVGIVVIFAVLWYLFMI
jgi:hypothetical protein